MLEHPEVSTIYARADYLKKNFVLEFLFWINEWNVLWETVVQYEIRKQKYHYFNH